MNQKRWILNWSMLLLLIASAPPAVANICLDEATIPALSGKLHEDPLEFFERNRDFYERYATFLVQSAVQLRKGQKLVIGGDHSLIPFLELIRAHAIEHGAGEVVIETSDIIGDFHTLKSADGEARFAEKVAGVAQRYQRYADENFAFIGIRGMEVNHEKIEGSDPKVFAEISKRLRAAMTPYTTVRIRKEVPWTLAAAPTEAGATKIFGEPSFKQRYLEVIETATRLKGDPVQNWKEHTARLKARRDHMDKLDIVSMTIETKGNQGRPGTSLTVDLAKNSNWHGGASQTPDGQDFLPNVPTEEVYGTPHWATLTGRMVTSRPVMVEGTTVKDAWIEFRNGRAWRWGIYLKDGKSVADAWKQKRALDAYFEKNERNRYSGEIGGVDSTSAIAETGLVFEDILFDENAAWHMALGKAYPFTIRGGNDMTTEELLAMGANASDDATADHLDFMLGDQTLNVTARTRSGGIVDIVKDGKFTFLVNDGFRRFFFIPSPARTKISG